MAEYFETGGAWQNPKLTREIGSNTALLGIFDFTYGGEGMVVTGA
jgi:hypothetical protein